MHFAFIALVMVALGKKYWRRNKNNLMFKMLAAFLAPKQKVELSKATRTASKTVLMQYQHKDQTYDLILPIRSRPMGWTHCRATMQNGEIKEVAAEVLSKSGPMKDFFGIKLKPHQVYRGAVKLDFHNPKRKKSYLILK